MDQIVNRILAYTNATVEQPSSITSSNAAGADWQLSIRRLEDVKVGVVCFSKDRPYQLHQFLRSVAEFCQPLPAVISVVYLATTPATTVQYERVFAYHKQCLLSIQTIAETDFGANLSELLASSWTEQQVTHAMFCVDDLLFIQSVNVFELANLLDHHQDVFTYHLKLHPGISFSHASSKSCPPPPLKAIPHNDKPTQYSLKFDYVQGKVDWRYPFDLCAALYRLEDVHALLTNIRDVLHLSIKNPNLFETYGNQAYWKLISTKFTKYRSAFCSPTVVLNVVTINKVQTTFDVPIFSSPQFLSHDIDTCSLDYLNNTLLRIDSTLCSEDNENKLIDNSKNFNLHQYRTSVNNISVHVGDVFFDDQKLTPPPIGHNSAKVTVLLPVYNEDVFLPRCLQALLSSNQGVPYKILAVNDGSSDNSQHILEEFQAKAHSQGLEMDIIALPSNKGLVHALDAGIQRCTTEFIARIDADDECLDHRLSRQMDFLANNNHIHCVGCNAIVVEDKENAETASSLLVTTMPCHPVLAAHRMFMNCQLLHPSVMFRTAVIKDIGGYSAAISEQAEYSTIEDYAMWMRLLRKHSLCIANIPDVGIILRRRSQSKSRREFHQSNVSKRLLLQRELCRFMDIDQSSVECAYASFVVDAECTSMRSEDDADSTLALFQQFLETFQSEVLRSFPVDDDVKSMLQLALRAQHQVYQRQLVLNIKKKFPKWSSKKTVDDGSNITTLQAKDSIFDALVSKLT